MRSQRSRSRLVPQDVRSLLRPTRQLVTPLAGVSRRAHVRRHGYASLVYTSGKTLTTQPSTPLWPQQGGRLAAVRLQVANAPASGDLIVDVLFDGVSIYDSDASRPRIQTGNLVGYANTNHMRRGWARDTKIQIQVVQQGAATGPLVVELLYEPEYR